MEETAKNNKTSRIGHLFILSYPDRFVFYDADAPEHPALELNLEAPVDFPDRFEDVIRINGWTGKHFLKVMLTEHSDRFIILPSEIDDPEQQRSFFDMAFTPERIGELMIDPLSDGKQLFCCEIPSNRLNCYKQQFSDLQLYNHAFLLTEWVYKQAAEKQQTTMLAYKYGRSMQLFVASRTDLLFANNFLTRAIADATYFCLRSIEQLNLDPFTTRYIVCSSNDNGKELADTLSPYLKNIEQAQFTGMPDNLLLLQP